MFCNCRHPTGYNTPFTGCIRSIKIDEHELQFREPDPKLLASTDIGACAGMNLLNCFNIVLFLIKVCIFFLFKNYVFGIRNDCQFQ